MSWWPVPDSRDEVTGDAAVDAVDGALSGLASARELCGQARPTLAELVAALDAALSSTPNYIADGERLGQVVVRGVEPATSVPSDLRDAVRGALPEIAAAYARAFQRRPSLAEALYTFTFALGGVAGQRLSGPLPEHISFVTRG